MYKELGAFTRIIEIVDQQYVGDIDEHLLIEGAIQGMLQSLDPHTIYFSPENYKEFKSDTSGRYAGVGMEITLKDGVVTVVAPLEDSPAHKNGIKAGDRILRINGKSTKGMSLYEAVSLMRGPKGKKVAVSIWRDGMGKPRPITLVRQIIKVKSVKFESFNDGYGYIRIASFQEKTTAHLKQALETIQTSSNGHLKGIVLDLRDNPGGLLDEAIKIADLFLAKGVIVSTKGRKHKTTSSRAQKSSPYEKVPLVVLVNQGSASASEIVAGALQDHRRAKVLGSPSFGKGSVQTLIPLGEGDALKLTIAHYYTPRGRSIEGKGIQPDVKLDEKKLNKEFRKQKTKPTLADYQKTKALSYLRKI